MANDTTCFQACTCLSDPHRALVATKPSLCLLLKHPPLANVAKDTRLHETVLKVRLWSKPSLQHPNGAGVAFLTPATPWTWGKIWVFPALLCQPSVLLLLLSMGQGAAPELCSTSRSMGWEEQGCCHRGHSHHCRPGHKEERSQSLYGKTWEYGQLPLKNNN